MICRGLIGFRILVPRRRCEHVRRRLFVRLVAGFGFLDRSIEIQAQRALRHIGLEARLIDQARAHKAVAAPARIQHHQKVRDAVAILSQPVPERLVSPAPEQPRVPSANRVALGIVDLAVAIRVEVQRMQRAVLVRAHHVHPPEKVARLRGEALRCPRHDWCALHRLAGEGLVHRLALVRLCPQFLDAIKFPLRLGRCRCRFHHRLCCRFRRRRMCGICEQRDPQADGGGDESGDSPQVPGVERGIVFHVT